MILGAGGLYFILVSKVLLLPNFSFYLLTSSGYNCTCRRKQSDDDNKDL